jgi:glutaredoxin 3
MSKAILYTKDYCPFCSKAKKLLSDKEIPYEDIDITNDEGLQEKAREVSGRKTVPQIFFGDYHIGGYDELEEVENKGELEDLASQYLDG